MKEISRFLRQFGALFRQKGKTFWRKFGVSFSLLIVPCIWIGIVYVFINYLVGTAPTDTVDQNSIKCKVYPISAEYEQPCATLAYAPKSSMTDNLMRGFSKRNNLNYGTDVVAFDTLRDALDFQGKHKGYFNAIVELKKVNEKFFHCLDETSMFYNLYVNASYSFNQDGNDNYLSARIHNELMNSLNHDMLKANVTVDYEFDQLQSLGHKTPTARVDQAFLSERAYLTGLQILDTLPPFIILGGVAMGIIFVHLMSVEAHNGMLGHLKSMGLSFGAYNLVWNFFAILFCIFGSLIAVLAGIHLFDLQPFHYVDFYLIWTTLALYYFTTIVTFQALLSCVKSPGLFRMLLFIAFIGVMVTTQMDKINDRDQSTHFDTLDGHYPLSYYDAVMCDASTNYFRYGMHMIQPWYHVNRIITQILYVSGTGVKAQFHNYYHWSDMMKAFPVNKPRDMMDPKPTIVCTPKPAIQSLYWLGGLAAGFIALYWYFSQVMGNNTVTLPWNFPFKLSYWFPSSKKKTFEVGLIKSLREKSKNGICVHNLSKAYKDNAALKEVTTEVKGSQIVCVLGPSGAGKSSLIGILTGTIPQTHGHAFVFGKSVKNEMDDLRNQMGIVPQFDVLFDSLTGPENLEFWLRFKGLKKKDEGTDIEYALRSVNLWKYRNRPCGQYSGGMRRRLSLAVSILGSPKLLYLDEPLSGCDVLNRARIVKTVQSLRKRSPDMLVIWCTHSMDTAEQAGDQIMLMQHGRIRAVGSSIYLRRAFGEGHRLALVLSKSGHEKMAMNAIHTVAPDATIAQSNDKSLVVTIPSYRVQQIPRAIAILKRNQLLSEWSLSGATLEDVFLNLVKSDHAVMDDGKGVKHMICQICGENPTENVNLKSISGFDIEVDHLVCNQCAANPDKDMLERLFGKLTEEDEKMIDIEYDDMTEAERRKYSDDLGLPCVGDSFTDFKLSSEKVSDLEKFTPSGSNWRQFKTLLWKACISLIHARVAWGFRFVAIVVMLIFCQLTASFFPKSKSGVNTNKGNLYCDDGWQIDEHSWDYIEPKLACNATRYYDVQQAWPYVSKHLYYRFPDHKHPHPVFKGTFIDYAGLSFWHAPKMNKADYHLGGNHIKTKVWLKDVHKVTENWKWGVWDSNIHNLELNRRTDSEEAMQKENIDLQINFWRNASMAPPSACRENYELGTITPFRKSSKEAVELLNNLPAFTLEVKDFDKSEDGGIYIKAKSLFRSMGLFETSKVVYPAAGTPPTTPCRIVGKGGDLLYGHHLVNWMHNLMLLNRENTIGDTPPHKPGYEHHCPFHRRRKMIVGRVGHFPYYSAQSNDSVAQQVFMMFMMVVSLMMFPVQVNEIIFERKNRVLTLLRLQGMKQWIYWLTTSMGAFLSNSIVQFMWIGMGYAFQMEYFLTRPIWHHILFGLLWAAAATGLALFTSGVFIKSNMGVFFVYLYICLAVILAPLMTAKPDKSPFKHDTLSWLSVAYCRALFFMIKPTFGPQDVPKLWEGIYWIMGSGAVMSILGVYLHCVRSANEQEAPPKKKLFFLAWIPKLLKFLCCCGCWCFHRSKKDKDGMDYHRMSNISMDSVVGEDDYDLENISDLPTDLQNERKMARDGDAPIRVMDLTKIYKTKYETHKAVDNFNLCVDSDQCLGLLGPNGCGKTTTLNMLTGVLAPTNGRVWLDGVDALKNRQATTQNLGICPQFDAYWPNLTVTEHLKIFAAVKGVPEKIVKPWILKLLELIQLDGNPQHQRVGTLSGGQRRRLSLAIAMIGNPLSLLLDEPTTGLDPASKRAVWATVHRLRSSAKRSIILTTHEMEEVEALCSRVAMLVKGKLQCVGSPLELKRRYADGYQLDVRLRSKEMFAEFTKFVKSRCSTARVTFTQGENISFVLPMKEARSSVICRLFSDLQNTMLAQIKLGVVEWNLSQAGLERVFLKTVENANGGAQFDEISD
eukprot:TRINITY_DN1110_c0_g1_i1.p1 TRINITY_DN1110_c0_g1~~TRINITY_DN1110_c0_g1_i1.p1  ORF type:complete len:1933 (+),score=502.60 TRINITY_DN1110_c0_g1_i1:91-5889(+)